jgi:hypothetical protein
MPYLAGNGALLEVGERDVGPYVAVQAQQDGVEARQRAKELGHVVMRLNLRKCNTPLIRKLVLERRWWQWLCPLFGALCSFQIHAMQNLISE